MFSESRASAPDSGFRIDTSGHVVGVDADRCRTNQRAAHAAPKAHIEPKTLAAMKSRDNQVVVSAQSVRDRQSCSIWFARRIDQSCKPRLVPRVDRVETLHLAKNCMIDPGFETPIFAEIVRKP